MRTVVKKSVSLREDLWLAIEEMAQEENTSISAIINVALERTAGIRAGLKAVDRWEAEHGPLTAEELAEADAILDAAGVGRAAPR